MNNKDRVRDGIYIPVHETIIEEISKINSVFDLNDELILCVNISFC